jgi:hypothetical protein
VIPTAVSTIKLAEHPDGSVDKAALKAAFSMANLKTEAGAIITCAAAEAYKAILAALVPSAPGIAARTAPSPTAAALQSAFAELRAAQFPGVAIVTSMGTL